MIRSLFGETAQMEFSAFPNFEKNMQVRIFIDSRKVKDISV